MPALRPFLAAVVIARSIAFVGTCGTVALLATPASAQTPPEASRFAVVNASNEPTPETLVPAIEREVARLRPGSRPLEDQVMRRLLATGEGPAAAAVRLAIEAQERRLGGDCAGAVSRAREAENLALNSASLDEERDLLRRIYVLLVMCEHERGQSKERDEAARRLRGLVETAPSAIPEDVWKSFVEPAVAGPPVTELQIDSEPPNAQVSIDFRGSGLTPRTLKVPKGTLYVEVQKEGYLKAFRKVEVGDRPVRTVFRLVERTRNRLDQAHASVRVLRQEEPPQQPRTLSSLAQLARVDHLVVFTTKGNRAKIWFFDAERGALAKETVESEFDPATGRVAALETRTSPPSGTAKLSPSAATPETTAPEPAVSSLPEARAEVAPPPVRPKKKPAPWWSWVIAGALGASLMLYIYADRPQRAETLSIRAYRDPPPPVTR